MSELAVCALLLLRKEHSDVNGLLRIVAAITFAYCSAASCSLLAFYLACAHCSFSLICARAHTSETRPASVHCSGRVLSLSSPGKLAVFAALSVLNLTQFVNFCARGAERLLHRCKKLAKILRLLEILFFFAV